MEIKAKLNKPYTDEERCNFIVEYNHRQGYKIEEADNALLAWGYTEEEKRQQEQDCINHLKMTSLDFLKCLYSLGLTREQVYTFLDENTEIKEELTYCQNVYCGVVKQLLPITIGEFTLTSEMVEQAFILKNSY